MRPFHLIAHPHAPGAQDAAVVVEDEALVGGVHRQVRMERQQVEMADAQGLGVALETAVLIGHAHGADVVTLQEEQLDYVAPVVDEALGVGSHLHPLLHRSGAGGEELGGTLELDHAQAAGAHVREAFEMAQGGDVYAVLLGRRQHGLMRTGGHVLAVDDKSANIGHLPTSRGHRGSSAYGHRASQVVGLQRARVCLHGAGAGLAHPVVDVSQVLVAEVAQGGEHRVGRALAQAAQAGGPDHAGQAFQAVEVGRRRLALLMRSSIRYISSVPTRQGTHLPQDSSAKSMKNLATSTMHVVSSMTIMPPEPMMEPAADSVS